MSLAVHVAHVRAGVLGRPESCRQRTVTQAFDNLNDQIVWLDVPGPGGGGGGGGNQSPEPVKQVELKGKDKITVPVEKPPAIEQPKEKPPEDPIQNLTIPAQTLASADLAQAGAHGRRFRHPSRSVSAVAAARERGRAPASVRAADLVLATDGAAAPAAARIVRATASKRRACSRK